MYPIEENLVNSHLDEVKQTATTLLAAMLSNPHIYAQTKIDGGDGQMEQKLIILAAEMAEHLIDYVENNHRFDLKSAVQREFKPD